MSTDEFSEPGPGEPEAGCWWAGKTCAVAETDEACVVLGPRGDATPEELKSLGDKLQHWQRTHQGARHIWGLDDLLGGRRPRTPPIYLMVPYPDETFPEC